MRRIIIYFLNKKVKILSFYEQSLEINQDLIENVNEEWQEVRKNKDAIKRTIAYLKQ